MPHADLTNPDVVLRLRASGLKWRLKDAKRGYVEISAEQAKELGLDKAHLADEKKMAEKADKARQKDMAEAKKVAEQNAAEARRLAEKEAAAKAAAAEAAEEAARKAGRLPGRAL
jgi:hypothetical protein